MACNKIQFSIHGLIKLTDRNIEAGDVVDVVRNGATIFDYPKDKPYPSRLVIGWVKVGENNKALHVVVAEDIISNNCVVVTAYWPDENKWQADFRAKIKKL